MTEITISDEPDPDAYEFSSNVAFYDAEDRIILQSLCSETKIVRVLNHEYLHAVLQKLFSDSTSTDFDNLFATEEDVDKTGCPKFSVDVKRKEEQP